MDAPISKRLTAEIARNDAEAEIRISWVQLVLALFFSALYIVAPRAEGGSMFNIVPAALGIYIAFVSLRIGLAHARRLRPWFLIISIYVDIGLIAGLIYSFHIQYGQPAAFYLKVPTILYMVLLISLRALRFDPFYVVLSGLTAATAWGMLALYAIVIDPDTAGITRNYVEHLNGNMILIGAEIDKMIVIVAVTTVIAYALVRARRLLFTAVADHAAVGNLSRFFTGDVAKLVGSEDPENLRAGYGRSREIAVVFVDVRGFTPLSQSLGPQRSVELLSHYHAVIVPVIVKHSGSVDKFLGDGILVSFGAIEESQTMAADALRFLEALPVVERQLNARLDEHRFGVTVHLGGAMASGTALVGIVGDDDRLEHTVIGDPVNDAAKLEDMNKALGTVSIAFGAAWERGIEQGYQPITRPKGRPSRPVPGLKGEHDIVMIAERGTASV